MNRKKIGVYGSCQLHLCSDFFFNEEIIEKNNLEIIFALASYKYDYNYFEYTHELDYKIFDNIDILIIELNKYENNASSDNIIKYCQEKNIKIIKTCMITFPIFPINWSGYGDNPKDYINWIELDKIDYKTRFKKIIDSLKLKFINSNLDLNIINYIEENFNKKLLFLHSLHPTNILLYELWKSIFNNLNIKITDYKYKFDREILEGWLNPYTTKMFEDLDIKYEVNIDDNFYLERYNENKLLFLNIN